MDYSKQAPASLKKSNQSKRWSRTKDGDLFRKLANRVEVYKSDNMYNKIWHQQSAELSGNLENVPSNWPALSSRTVVI